ncbi:MAG: hypothetical protein LC659_02720 [Myxococcales bacterium]|nr:hypothetical protein [Myxococcales bacterium]
MRVFGLGLTLMIAFAVFGVDVGESWRAGSISDGSAHAKRHHRRHKRSHRRRHKPRRAPASEM